MTTSEDPRLSAKRFLEEALKLLDLSGAPADIGAHVDCAVTRLSDELGHPIESSGKVR